VETVESGRHRSWPRALQAFPAVRTG
jgi:hypothetical protein